MSASDGEPREGVGRREAQSIVDRIAVWANGRSEIRGLALAGSYARGSERPDSDVDVLLLTNEPARFIDTVDWLDVLGNPPVVRSEHFGVVTERRVRLPSGLEVEFGIAALGWAQVDPVDTGTRRVVEEGFRVLHDPDGRLADLQAAVSSSDEHIRIDSYDPTWPARFEQERAALAEMIGQWITGASITWVAQRCQAWTRSRSSTSSSAWPTWSAHAVVSSRLLGLTTCTRGTGLTRCSGFASRTQPVARTTYTWFQPTRRATEPSSRFATTYDRIPTSPTTTPL